MNRIDIVAGGSVSAASLRAIAQRASAAKDLAEVSAPAKSAETAKGAGDVRGGSLATYSRGVKVTGVAPQVGLGGVLDARG